MIVKEYLKILLIYTLDEEVFPFVSKPKKK